MHKRQLPRQGISIGGMFLGLLPWISVPSAFTPGLEEFSGDPPWGST